MVGRRELNEGSGKERRGGRADGEGQSKTSPEAGGAEEGEREREVCQSDYETYSVLNSAI